MTKISDDFGDLQGPIFSFGLSGRDPIGKQKIPGPGAYELAQVWTSGGLGGICPRCPSPNRESGEGNLLDFKKCPPFLDDGLGYLLVFLGGYNIFYRYLWKPFDDPY